jgi:hypothetical protein
MQKQGHCNKSYQDQDVDPTSTIIDPRSLENDEDERASLILEQMPNRDGYDHR